MNRHLANETTRSGSGETPANDTLSAGKRTLVQQESSDGSYADSATEVDSGVRPGRPLDPDTRGKMEFAFGTDFANVRLHEGPQARAAGSIAFARGEDLYFQPGAYDPGSAKGQELIGHELAHVVQQRDGRVTAMAKGGRNTDPALEREADDLGARAASGQQVAVASGSGEARADGPMQLQTDSALQFLGPLLESGIAPGDSFTAAEEQACQEARDGDLDFLAVETPEALLAVRVLEQLVAKIDRLIAAGAVESRTYRPARAKLARVLQAWGDAARDVDDATDPSDVNEWSDKGRTADRNKLYIGGGAQIDAKVASNPLKQQSKHSRILDVDDARWTWFVNKAWMEAGMQNDARFKLTTALTDEIKALLLAGGVTGDAFLAAVADKIAPLGTPHPLWHSGDGRATYFAHEIAMLLDAGYLFEEVDRANHPGEKKQQFVRP